MQASPSGIERYVERLWYGESSLAWVLQPFAFVFRLLVAVRRLAYRSGLLRSERIAVPVIVIGNITVGGTGKTPLTAWLVGRLTDAGFRPGVVSRGYGGRGGKTPRLVDRDSDVRDAGDEALVLARRTQAPICISVDRTAAARHLVDRAGVNIIVADDGLQHYRLARDLEIAVVDGERVLGNRRLLPAGPLREPPARLASVDFVFINGESSFSAGHLFELAPERALSLDGSARRDLREFSGMRVWSVAGIGNPGRFNAMLRAAGVDPVAVEVPDHGFISLPELRREQAWPILMTEKDAVKYFEIPIDNAWYVPVAVQMSEQVESLVMQRIRTLMPDD
jgi:tetraacyldisaccharide 4'-kinase